MTQQDFKVNANGFTVLNAHDGFRKDNTLWFGECSECGERVINSHLDGVWKHTVYLERGWYSMAEYERGAPYNSARSRDVDYCPTSTGKVEECVDYISANGVRVVIPA